MQRLVWTLAEMIHNSQTTAKLIYKRHLPCYGNGLVKMIPSPTTQWAGLFTMGWYTSIGLWNLAQILDPKLCKHPRMISNSIRVTHGAQLTCPNVMNWASGFPLGVSSTWTPNNGKSIVDRQALRFNLIHSLKGIWPETHTSAYRHWSVKFGPNLGPQALQASTHDK